MHMVFICIFFFFVALAQFGGAIGGIDCDCCKFNILWYILAKSSCRLISCFPPFCAANYQGKEAV
jgi:hypothetical protein